MISYPVIISFRIAAEIAADENTETNVDGMPLARILAFTYAIDNYSMNWKCIIYHVLSVMYSLYHAYSIMS